LARSSALWAHDELADDVPSAHGPRFLWKMYAKTGGWNGKNPPLNSHPFKGE